MPPKKKNSQSSNFASYRVAKNAPRWKSFLPAAGVVLALNIVYLGHRWWGAYVKSRRIANPHAALTEEAMMRMKERPDLAVAAVRMTTHYLLSPTGTPFGMPMVSPPFCGEEAEELHKIVVDWCAAYPSTSVADLWTLLSCKALESLGGPRVPLTVGRLPLPEADHPSDHGKNMVADSARVAVLPSSVPESCGDIRRLKRVLAEKELPLDQIVALVGVSRAIGFHEDVCQHKKKDEKGWKSSCYDSMPRQCTALPYQLENDYFRNLLRETWLHVEGTPGYYRCRKTESASRVSPKASSSPSDRATNICDLIAMRPVDLSLLDDRGTEAFVQRFAESRPRFDRAVVHLFSDIQKRGHNLNLIKEVK